MARTAFVYHPDFLQHDTGGNHPECPERLEAIIKRLSGGKLWDKLLHIEPLEAPTSALDRVHAPSHILQVETLAQVSQVTQLTLDNIGSAATPRAARLAAGAPLRAIDEVLAGRADNAFCCVRPPGHHAEFDQIIGFCFFNNIAVGAKYLREECGVEKVAIVDWDVHHGNGTQHTFDLDASVFFSSIHQYPHWPGSGSLGERGMGAGQGYTQNIPVPAGSTDADYLANFREHLAPALDRFKPNFLLLSAGFDAHRADPLSQTLLSEDGYRQLTDILLEIAAKHCGGRLVSLLEGGYDLEATAASVEAHLEALLNA